MTNSDPLAPGTRSPFLIGARLSGGFYASDGQAGRPSALSALTEAEPHKAAEAFSSLGPWLDAVLASGLDAVVLCRQTARMAEAFAGDPRAERHIVLTADEAWLQRLDGSCGRRAVYLDRSGRIVASEPLLPGDESALQSLKALAGALSSEAGTLRRQAAPVLIVPNLASPALCRALIDCFEGSDHTPGVMASVQDGAPAAKADESKKRRRDFELTNRSPLHAEVLEILGARCVPEIKRAFQCDISFADRILIARYDDTGGYFRRHRDDGAPQTAFRHFAVSLNLNAEAYEGGELAFPEYDDHRYSPPTGGALMFSASLLHEALPVRKGRRYVLLTFLCKADAKAAAA
jgi:predicted 2-oxoglutarate/Fe(II)-dependent dioxygenase YbiX